MRIYTGHRDGVHLLLGGRHLHVWWKAPEPAYRGGRRGGLRWRWLA